jgi:hypothetical protein
MPKERFSTRLLQMSEDQEYAERQWLENRKESAPFALAESVVPPARGEVVRTYS